MVKLVARDVVIHHRRQRHGDMLLAVDGATLDIEAGGFISIVGPSGCGVEVYLADRVAVFSARPGRVKEAVTIDLGRPRDLRIKRDPRFLEIEARVRSSRSSSCGRSSPPCGSGRGSSPRSDRRRRGFGDLLQGGELIDDIAVSAEEFLTGYILAAIVAIPLGLLIGW